MRLLSACSRVSPDLALPVSVHLRLSSSFNSSLHRPNISSSSASESYPKGAMSSAESSGGGGEGDGDRAAVVERGMVIYGGEWFKCERAKTKRVLVRAEPGLCLQLPRPWGPRSADPAIGLTQKVRHHHRIIIPRISPEVARVIPARGVSAWSSRRQRPRATRGGLATARRSSVRGTLQPGASACVPRLHQSDMPPPS